jgi:hypothetical protein
LATASQRPTGLGATFGSFLLKPTGRAGKVLRGGRNRQDLISSGGLQD